MENPDDVKFCRKCGKSFYLVTFKPYWLSIGLGVVLGLLITSLSYKLLGNDVILFATFVGAVAGGGITAVMAYNKNVMVDYDCNPSLNGALSGFITGIIALTSFVSTNHDAYIALANVISYAIWGFVGGTVGTVANLIRAKNIKWMIPFTAVIILTVVGIGCVITQNNTNGAYETAYANQFDPLYFDDLIQVEADPLLNTSTNDHAARISNLKEADTKYQRMVNITQNAQLWNKEMVKSGSSSIEKEYAQALGKYVDLRYNYYNEMELGIELEINGNRVEAEKHYKNAENLKPEIQNQETVLTEITNKNPKFKQYTDKRTSISKKFAEDEKQQSELMTFTFGCPYS